MRPDLQFAEVEGGAVIYDPRAREVHHVNQTAALVFGLCDGSATADEIAAAIAKVYKVPQAEVQAHVRNLLDRFREKRLLEEHLGHELSLPQPRKWPAAGTGAARRVAQWSRVGLRGGTSWGRTRRSTRRTPRVVAGEMAIWDRDSFADWYPKHVASVLDCAELLHIRIDPASLDRVVTLLEQQFADELADGTITFESQFSQHRRWEEGAERQALLEWALATGAEWNLCFDADEVIEPGGGQALHSLLLCPWAATFRVLCVFLSHSSHHRPGYVLPRWEPWRPPRAFRLDNRARTYQYERRDDGFTSTSVPYGFTGHATVPDLIVVHYHATTCAEFKAEAAFYRDRHSNRATRVEYLRCGFGDERLAVPLEQALAGAEERLARVSAGEGLMLPTGPLTSWATMR